MRPKIYVSHSQWLYRIIKNQWVQAHSM